MFGPRYAVIGSAVGVSEANGIGQPEAGTLEPPDGRAGAGAVHSNAQGPRASSLGNRRTSDSLRQHEEPELLRPDRLKASPISTGWPSWIRRHTAAAARRCPRATRTPNGKPRRRNGRGAFGGNSAPFKEMPGWTGERATPHSRLRNDLHRAERRCRSPGRDESRIYRGLPIVARCIAPVRLREPSGPSEPAPRRLPRAVQPPSTSTTWFAPGLV